MRMGRYTVGAMLIVVTICVLVPSAISQRKPISKEQLIRSCKPGRRERKPAASYIVMLQKQGVDFSPTVEDEVDIRAACRYLGEKELAELIAAIRYQYRLQEVLAKAERLLSPTPTPPPSRPSSPSPTPTPSWRESDEAKKFAGQMIADVQALADEGRLIDLTNLKQAVAAYNDWLEKVSVRLGEIDIKMRKFGQHESYKDDWDRYLSSASEGYSKELLRSIRNYRVVRLDSIVTRIKIAQPSIAVPAPNLTPTSTPTPELRAQTESKRTAGTELVGIGGTGVTARISTVRVERFDVLSTLISLTVENTSRSGTITNIGFFVKVVRKPMEGSKTTVPGEITPPGSYRFTNEDLAVETSTFKAICAFAFMTSRSSSFHNGNVGGGIPPGQSTRFSLAGDQFLAGITGRQFERGIILRFQEIGTEELDDIALYPNPNVLFSVSDPVYQISKVAPK